MDQKLLDVINASEYTIGVYATDLKGNEFKYNENKKFESASCIKLFILIEYFKQVYEGKIKTTDVFTYTKEDKIEGADAGIIGKLDFGLKLTSKDCATLMIIYSDNIATNKLIDCLGIENINNTIKELGFEDTRLLHELNLLKYFEFGITTPFEYAKAYKMILNEEVINPEISKNVLDVLKKQQKSDLLNKGLPQYDLLFRGDETSKIKYIASKGGSIVYTDDEMKNCRNDGGIISTIYGEYIVSIFVSDVDDLQFNYDNKGIEIGAEIHKVIFDTFIENKGEFK